MTELDFELVNLKSRFDKINSKEYYLSYSGGKDSHFLYWFIKEYLHDIDIEIVAINTRMEHPEIAKRMKKYADKVLIPEHTIQWVKDNYGIPCFSKQKDDYISRYQKGCRAEYLMSHIYGYNARTGQKEKAFKLSNRQRELLLSGKLHKISPMCCTITKKKTAHKFEKESGKKAILGITQSEGMLRKSKYKSCFNSKGTFTPMYDWNTSLIDEAYKVYRIELPEIYNHIKRTGCMGCPYGSYYGDTKRELELMNTNQYKYVTNLFKESYEVLGINIKQERLDLDV